MNTAIQERVHSLLVDRIGEAPPSAGSIQQLGDVDQPEDDLQRRITPAVSPQDCQCVESLHAVSDDTTDMVSRRQNMCDSDA